jgi:hypothetical protein
MVLLNPVDRSCIPDLRSQSESCPSQQPIRLFMLLFDEGNLHET